MNLLEKIKESADYIRSHSSHEPVLGMILGSGLGELANRVEEAKVFDYQDIPHFPVSTVAGHPGRLVIGKLKGKTVVAMQGRFHYYEGYTMQEVTFPVRVMKALGVQAMIVTNACGGINPDLYPGALMFIKDHINFTGNNPLIGQNFEELGPRFPDMSAAYDKEYIRLGQEVAKEQGTETFLGIYTSMTGPYYCPPAELAMVRSFGSDTIGMSTVPEVIVAVHMGIRCLGISCVTDMAIPESVEPLSHEQVVKVAAKARPKFMELVSGIVEKMEI